MQAVLVALVLVTCIRPGQCLHTHAIAHRKNLTVRSSSHCCLTLFQLHYESRGEWVNRNQTQEELQWDARYRHCTLHISMSKHQCPNATVLRTRQWNWEGSPSLPSLMPQQKNSILGSWMDGKTLTFWGDSVTAQLFQSFVCSFYAAGANVTRESLKSIPTTKAPPSNDTQLSHPPRISPTKAFRIEWPTTNGTATVRVVEAICPFLLLNTGEVHVFTPKNDTLCDPLPSILLQDWHTTHLIANIAYWFRGPKDSGFALSSAFRALEQFFLSHPTIPPPHFLWRGISSKHYYRVDWTVTNQSGCDQFLQPNFHLQPSKLLYYDWMKSMNAAAIDILIKESEHGVFPRMDFFDVQYFDRYRGDAHMGGRDCTHYCGPAVPSVWVRWLVQLLYETQR